MNDDTLLTLGEVRIILRVSKAQASKLCRGLVPGTPVLPSLRIGRRVLVRKSALFDWITANAKSSVRCVQR